MTQGIVLYTDGGCKPSRGRGGWGMHGYLYSSDTPKKGSGNQDVILTPEGYVTKQVANANATDGLMLGQVTPIQYVDGHGSWHEDVTNNIAELTAATRALEYALDYELTSAWIWTDSEYVKDNLEKNVRNWERNGWVRHTGEPVANVEQWKALVAARDRLKVRGVKIKFNWVKGHNGDTGNSLADNLASIGVILSRKNIVKNSILSTPADGYWKYESDKHPMIAHRRCYFNTSAGATEPGVYYLGNHGKEDDLLGKRISDGAFSVVRLQAPDPAMEMIRDYQVWQANFRDVIMMLRLDQIFKPSFHRDLMLYGPDLLQQLKPYRLDLHGPDVEEPVSRELTPPGLAQRAVEAASDLAGRLDAYLAKDASITVTDVTAILYETTQKVKKVKGGGETVEVIQTLKSDYNVGFASMNIDAFYGADGKAAKVTLTLGIDLLDRNALKRLEGLKPQVKVISWLESPTAFRYATVVEAGEDKGIWSGVYSNLRIVS